MTAMSKAKPRSTEKAGINTTPLNSLPGTSFEALSNPHGFAKLSNLSVPKDKAASQKTVKTADKQELVEVG